MNHLPRGRAALRRSSFVLLVPLLAAAMAECRARAPQAAAAAGRGPLLVTIVIDQMAAWIAAEHWPELPESGGFARLRREGLTVQQLRFAHAVTDTAPGHSALYTGAVPRATGIVANERLGPDGRGVSIVADPTTRLVGGALSDREGASLAALRVETLADALRAQRPHARIFSFSLKDRGALFGGGRRPDLVLWFDPKQEAFVTSTAFSAGLPAWAASLAGPEAVRRARAAPWKPLDPGWLAAHAETPDQQPGEGDYDGLGTEFPHLARSAKAERATPAGDALLFALAGAAAGEAASSGAPTLIALSLSSHDYVAHLFGAESWEAWDELRRLDAGLGALLATLDRLVGSDGYAVMLSADHGSNALPEVLGTPAARWCGAGRPSSDPRPSAPWPSDLWQRPCGRGRRLSTHELAAALESVAARVLGEPPADPTGAPGARRWVAGISEPYAYLAPAARALPAEKRARFVREAGAFLGEHYDVAALVDARQARETCPALDDESVQALVCRSLRPDGPGDLYLVVGPGTFFDPDYAPGHGTSHGSPYLYDRAVPLLVRAPGRIRGGATRTTPVPFTAFARTAASLLGVRPPAAAGPGPDLTR